MQEISGFAYFEGKSVEEVKDMINKIKLDHVEIGFFKEIFRNNETIKQAGIFLRGNVEDSYSSRDIVALLRRELKLTEELKGCDISIESEDKLKQIVKGRLIGNYIGIRIKPPYDLEDVYQIAKNMGDFIESDDVFVRTVELENKTPLVCIDLITKKSFEESKKEIDMIISSNGLIPGYYTSFSLE